MQNITVINHTIRLKLGLSCNEYCIIDLFHTDWKAANGITRQALADRFGLSKASVVLLIKQMCKQGLMEHDGKFYTTTARWSALFEETRGDAAITNGRTVWRPQKLIGA